jgi:hypothetical protein
MKFCSSPFAKFDWNNFDEWVEDRERKLQEEGKVIRYDEALKTML